MELVYLWVEKYKNIENQGFNFSPRFECKFHDKYNDDGSLKNDCVLDIKPKEHIENFFGENINVTAIVGKNGSGKSNLLEFIRLALKKEKYIEKYKGLIVFFDQDKKEFVLLNLLKTTISIQSDITTNQINFQSIESFNEALNNTIFPTFDYSLTYNLSNYVRHKNQNAIQHHFPLIPEKLLGRNTLTIGLLKEKRENIKKMLFNFHTIKKENNWGIFENFFRPWKICIYIDFEKFQTNNLMEEQKNNADNLKNVMKENLVNNEHILFLKNIENLQKVLSQTGNVANFDAIHNFDDMFEINFTVSKELIDKNIFKDFKVNEINGELGTQLIFEWEIEELKTFEIESIVENFIEPYFQIELLDMNQKKFNDLSFGEQQLLNMLNGLYYVGSKAYENDVTIIENNVEDIDGNIHEEIEYEKRITLPIENFVIFFDEIELGLHPRWQAQTIKYIINFLSNIKNRNLHLIIVTHSPFILSDLPKENVIFLEGGKQVYPNIDTFGANIHTLLSHGFFMKDGLMGEFAKEKINQIINYLNDKESEIKDNETAQKYINLIGEPILKRQLQKMLDSKRISRIDEIDELKKRIALLESKQ